jgi:hypothetical protein
MTANSRSPVYGAVDIGFQSILKNYLPLADLRFDLDHFLKRGVPKRPTKDEARRMAVNFAKPPELKALQTATEWTLQAQPGAAIGPFHWKNRRLTFQEMCRLQTFPDGQSEITLDLALKWDAGPRDGATAFRGA